MKSLQEIAFEVTGTNPGAMYAVQQLQYLSDFDQALLWLSKHNIKEGRLHQLWNDVYRRSGIQWCDAIKNAMHFKEDLTDNQAYELLVSFQGMTPEEVQRAGFEAYCRHEETLKERYNRRRITSG
jgi:hypothetical protein